MTTRTTLAAFLALLVCLVSPGTSASAGQAELQQCVIDMPVQKGAYDFYPWPGGIVPYEIDPAATMVNPVDLAGAMGEIEAVCGVNFVPRNGEPDYIRFLDSTDPNVSISSWVGRKKGQQTIRLWDSPPHSIIVHELMHALGFFHEQQRPDRDNYIHIEEQNVKREPEDRLPQFNIMANAFLHGPYDFDSIMHYHACAFSICSSCSPSDANCRTMTVLPPYTAFQNTIGTGSSMSSGDVEALSFLYGPNVRPDNSTNRNGNAQAWVFNFGELDPVGSNYNVTDASAVNVARNAHDEGGGNSADGLVESQSAYVGYDGISANYSGTISITSQVAATLDLATSSAFATAEDIVQMGFIVSNVASSGNVEVLLYGAIATEGDVEVASVTLTGPGVNWSAPVGYFNQTLSLGEGSYSLSVHTSVSLSHAAPFSSSEQVVALVTLTTTSTTDHAPGVLAGPFFDPSGTKKYYLLDDSTWHFAEAAAWALGGELVFVDNAAENDWILQNVVKFDNQERYAWLGYSDAVTEGSWKHRYLWWDWYGRIHYGTESMEYNNWGSGLPDNGAGEHFVLMRPNTGNWDDVVDNWNQLTGLTAHGVVEVVTSPLQPLAGPIVNLATGSSYYLLPNATWSQAQANAERLGGNLVTINDEAENTWVRQNVAEFDATPRHAWLGLTDRDVEGTFTWVSGDASPYRHWFSGEPNGGVGENYTVMAAGDGRWFDASDNWSESNGAVYGIVEVPGTAVLAGPILNGATGSKYYLLANSTWTDAEQAAAILGGTLVTINDAAENDWVRTHVAEYGGVSRNTWIGLTDQSSEGTFVWISGEVAPYSNWIPGEPNNYAGENYTVMAANSSQWFDAANNWNELYAPVYGIVEVSSPTATENAPGMAFTLHPNTPNPFNPVTTIQFDIPQPGNVNLSIYDLAGRRVRVLVHKALAAGTHSVQWNGRDDKGSTLASGVYLYRLESGGQMATQKMILLK